MLPIIFILPLLQLLILSNAASFEVKNIRMAVVDNSKSTFSRTLFSKFNSSIYFNDVQEFETAEQANKAIQKGTIDAVLEIPNHFERNLVTQNKPEFFLKVNAIDGAAAGVINVYALQIIQSMQTEMQLKVLPFSKQQKIQAIETIPSFWFNKTLNYKTFMVPGILVLLVTMLTMFLSSMNIVREKEIGTLEQINVTPIKKHQFIIGKLFPFWVLGLVILTVGLVISKLVFSIPIVGSIALIYFFTAIYLVLVLGIGLFISNQVETQQQAMFMTWFFVVVFILMSGLFTPIESMPNWAQKVTYFNPIRYFVEVIRMVLLKGATFSDVKNQLNIISAFAVVVMTLSVYSYKKSN